MVQQVLQRFDFTYSSPQATPLSTRHSLSALPSDESVERSGPYPELVGCLMYLITCTRPDLAYPLSILARYVAPGRHRPEHMAAAKRVLRYLCSTSGMGLVLGGRRPVVLTGHADASWADDQAMQRSSQGYTFSLGSGSVSWRSTRSSSVLSSSCEAEIYAGAMAAQELRWLTYLLTDLGEQPRSPPVMYVDNKAMLALCREHRLEHRTKHIALRYFLARELQQRGQLRLAYVASEANTDDIFTKALAPGDHQRLCTLLGFPTSAGAAGPGGAGAGGTGAVGGSTRVGAAGGNGAAGPGGARTRGTGAAGAGGAAGVGALGAGAIASGGAAGAGAAGCTGAGAAGGTRAGGATGVVAGDRRAEGTGAVSAVSGGAARSRPYYVPLLQQVLGLPPSTGPTPPLLSPPPVQSQSQLQPASPLPGPYPYSRQTRGLTERCQPESRPASPESRFASPESRPESLVRAVCTGRRVPRQRPPSVPGTHYMTLRPSTTPQRVPLPSPPASSLPDGPDPESDSLRAASPTVMRFLATVVIDPSFESALVVELVDFAPLVLLLSLSLRLSLLRPSKKAMDIEMASWKSTGIYVDEVPPPGRTSLHEEIWLRRPPGFTGSFPAGSKWSLRWPVYGLRQAPSEWHNTLRTTLAALGFAPSTADPSLFLHTNTTLPLVLRSRDRAQRTITLTQSHMVQQVPQRFSFTYSSPQSTPLPIGHSLSAPPSDESVEPSGTYPELVGCLITSGMGFVLGGLARVVLTGHADASRADDLTTQWSSQGYTFSLGSSSVSWQSTRSSSVLYSTCEAEIYARAMAAQELRWFTYLLTVLGEPPHSPPVLYVDNKAMIALCQEHRLEHRTKHIALRYFLARELQQCGQLCLAYVATRANTTDVFTKALQPCDHQRFFTVLGCVHCIA
ncbi:unnamed protein product, partial [Closterium sp. NIES-54]